MSAWLDREFGERLSQTRPCSTRTPLGLNWIPAPTSRSSCACSSTTNSTPRWRSARAVAIPPIPPPTMTTLTTEAYDKKRIQKFKQRPPGADDGRPLPLTPPRRPPPFDPSIHTRLRCRQPPLGADHQVARLERTQGPTPDSMRHLDLNR